MSSSVSCISNERPAVPINVCDDLPELGICFDAEEVGHEELVLCHGWSDNSLEICGTCAGTGTRTRGGTRISAMPYGHEAACSDTRWLTEAAAAWSELRRFPACAEVSKQKFPWLPFVPRGNVMRTFLADAAANGHETRHKPHRTMNRSAWFRQASEEGPGHVMGTVMWHHT